ncbi:FtsX-like permease family protein [Psychrobium sp. nBUS_13]|uniref:FtsX-like permease family protein n=1 Tax=Psychrobium sp. nBUS_13 TaxID=3395319 RepID=UPI003EBD3371
MSLAIKSLGRGVKRIFSLPRLSLSLVIALGTTLGVVLCVTAIISALLIRPLAGVVNAPMLKVLDFNANYAGSMNMAIMTPKNIIHASNYFNDIGDWGALDASTSSIDINSMNYAITKINGSSNIVEILGTRVLLGQGVEDNLVKNHVWISKSLWDNAYGQAQSTIGQTLTMSDKSYIIAGVLEDTLAIKSTEQIYTQQVWQLEDYSKAVSYIANSSITGNTVNNVVIKLNESNNEFPSMEALNDWMRHFIDSEIDIPNIKEFLQALPLSNKITDYKTGLLGASYTLVLALIITAIGLLLMATLNLINLFMSHYQSRTKEFAIQLSAGATASRLRFLMIIENIPSFMLAGILGTLLGSWLIKALPLLTNNQLPLLDSIHIDFLTIAIGFILVLSLSILFGCLSLTQLDRINIIKNLNSSGKGTAAQSSSSISKVLMVIQITIASLLVTGSIVNAKKNYDGVFEDIGMTIDNIQQLSFTIIDDSWFESLDSKSDELAQLEAQLAKAIEQEITDSQVILVSNRGVLRDGVVTFASVSSGDKEITYIYKHTNAGYFKAMNIAVLAGTLPTTDDIFNKNNARVIDENFAKVFFSGIAYDDIIGQKISFRDDRTVGAIVAETGFKNTRIAPLMYSYSKSAHKDIIITIALPTARELPLDQLKTHFDTAFNQLEITGVQSIDSIWNEMTAVKRLTLYVLIGITILTIILAAIGISGLALMTTHQKKYELAIRMSTGANQLTLITFILKQTMWVLAVGLLLGFAISAFGYDYFQKTITLLPQFNWLTLMYLDIGLIIVVLLSVLIPTWRVIKKDPLSALRQE